MLVYLLFCLSLCICRTSWWLRVPCFLCWFVFKFAPVNSLLLIQLTNYLWVCDLVEKLKFWVSESGHYSLMFLYNALSKFRSLILAGVRISKSLFMLSLLFSIRLLRRPWHLLSQPFPWMSIRSWTGKFYTWLSFDAIIIIIFFFILIQLPHQDTKSYTLKFLFSHSSKN